MKRFFFVLLAALLGGAVSLGTLAVVTACSSEGDSPTPVPDDGLNWMKAPAGCYEVEIKYECDCRDEVQAVVTAVPTGLPATEQPALGRWIYFRKTQLGVERLPIGSRAKLRLLRYRAVKNYHATALAHEDEEEFVCEAAQCDRS